MYPTLRDRQTVADLVATLSESLDMRSTVLNRTAGLVDYGLFGLEDDVADATRAVRRAGLMCSTRDVSLTRHVLIIKHVWTPNQQHTGEM